METNMSDMEIQIVCVYLTQMLGQPTVEQVRAVMKDKMGLDVGKVKVRNALNSAKKRGIVSVNHVQDERGRMEDAYSMKDVRFANPPEIAHIKNILPKLLEDEGAKQMFQEMEDNHTEGEKKGGRLPEIRDYVTADVECVNVLPILGGQPYADEGSTKSKCTHRRVGKNVWIPWNLWLRGAIAPTLRQYNLNESKARYIYSRNVLIPENEIRFEQYKCPSPGRPGGPGTGITTFEGITPGHTFKFVLRFPTTNGIPIEVMKEILQSGICIGARHREYGELEMVSFNIVTP